MKHNVNVLPRGTQNGNFLTFASISHGGDGNDVFAEDCIDEHSILVPWDDEKSSDMVCKIGQIHPGRAVEANRLFLGEGVNDDHRGVRRSFISGNLMIT